MCPSPIRLVGSRWAWVGYLTPTPKHTHGPAPCFCTHWPICDNKQLSVTGLCSCYYNGFCVCGGFIHIFFRVIFTFTHLIVCLLPKIIVDFTQNIITLSWCLNVRHGTYVELCLLTPRNRRYSVTVYIYIYFFFPALWFCLFPLSKRRSCKK